MKDIKTFIWDMDGVKYPLNSSFIDQYGNGVALAGSKMLGISEQEAREIVKKSKEVHGRSLTLFVDEYGLDHIALCIEAETFIDTNSFAYRNLNLLEKLEKTPVNHLILTEGNPVWASRILADVGLSEFYSKRRIITKQDYPHTSKRDSKHPFELAIMASGTAASHCVMIEDSADNLHHAKALGMTTVWLENSHSKHNASIDYVFENAESFLDYYHQNILNSNST